MLYEKQDGVNNFQMSFIVLNKVIPKKTRFAIKKSSRFYIEKIKKTMSRFETFTVSYRK